MQNIELLVASLEYMEEHLRDDIKTEDVAAACYCSKSSLEKLFRCVTKMSVHHYIIRRRMTCAAKYLTEHPEKAILDVALEFGYGTHESFTRAFKQEWNCKPSEFRDAKFTELFPRYRIPLENGEEYMAILKNSRPVDISELYDLVKERMDCYFVVCDIKNMTSINAVSRKVGDLSILESLNRLNDAAGENDVVFRIGGDEFCILTDSTDKAYAEGLAEQIKAKNGEEVSYEGVSCPMTLHVYTVTLGEKCRWYNKLFQGLHDAIENGKIEEDKV